ncbi:MAG: class I SAM-dependent RNA methyltransferase [Alkalilacustris sp.]
MTQTVPREVRIVRLGHRGDGITEDGLLASRTLPGEVVAGPIVEGRIHAPRILHPSPHRVRAPCPHYARCGGCALQHAHDDFVATWKAEVIVRALAAQGLQAPVRPVHTSPAETRRRAVLAGRRTKAGALVGFHAPASDQIVAIPDCRLLHPALRAALPALEALTAAGASRRDVLALTVTATDAGVDVAVRSRSGQPAARSGPGPRVDPDLAARLAAIAGARGLARLTWNGDTLAQAAPPTVRLGRATVPLAPGAFLQATADGEAALVAAVRTAVDRAARITDLFAGCGTFALPLSEAAEVHALEGDAALTESLTAGWRATPGLRQLRAETRDLFRRPLLAAELTEVQAVVIDPPRAGAEAQCAQIAASDVPVVAAVSCNPVTFARDARILVAAGFRLEWVQPVDQFRWSRQVELAARLSRPHMGRA